MAAPTIVSPDGTELTSVLFSTSTSAKFFYGTADTSTVDVEVSVYGAAFSSDSDYVVFDGSSWTVPNPDVFPDGLPLDAGENIIQVRSISSSGAVSSPSTITVYYAPSSASSTAPPPTNITVEQERDRVIIQAEASESVLTFRGMNFYASNEAGGGAFGYSRINLYPVDDYTTVEELNTLSNDDVQGSVPLNSNGEPVYDPYSWRIIIQGEEDDTLVSSYLVEIPEDARVVRANITTSIVRDVRKYSFSHSRTGNKNTDPPTIFVSVLASHPVQSPLFYVVTSVYYDENNSTEVESAFSVEVVGRPIVISTDTKGIPVVGRKQVVRSMIESIQQSNRQLRVDPGSVLRDTFIDPASSEIERVRFLLDFLQRAGSIAGLRSIDDPDGSGVSVSVGSSLYKTALKRALQLTRDEDVQTVIDQAFESLASNLGLYRLSGKFSRGSVTFYTTKRPTQSINIPLGTVVSGGSVQLRVLSSTTIPLSDTARYYDPVQGRYQITVPVQATMVGSVGNIAAGQVRKVVSGVVGLSVINTSAIFGGQDLESNSALADRTQRAVSSVDAGTAAGYRKTVAAVSRVQQVEVVSAGDDLMIRDTDNTGVHRGGKVDVWVRGESLSKFTDRFSLYGGVLKDVQFVVTGDPAELTFKIVGAGLSQTQPVTALIDDVDRELGLRNMSTGEYFTLTDYEIISYDTIQLSSDVAQPSLTLSDVVLGDIIRTDATTHTMTNQPVRSITSVIGSSSGVLPADAYSLQYTSDPMWEGRSVRSGDHVVITPVLVGGTMVPSGENVSVLDEPVVMEGEYEYPLKNVGVDFLSVVVRSSDLSTTYLGPGTANPDYLLTEGDADSSPTLRRVVSGRIASGDTVLVSYQHEENFVVTYTVNSIIELAQSDVDASKHATADVLIKEVIPVPVDLSFKVSVPSNTSWSSVSETIRNNLAVFFSRYKCGDAVRQSDVISVIDGTIGVRYVVLPLTLMARQGGSTVIREHLDTTAYGGVTYVQGMSSSTVSVWLINTSLSTATSDSGGPETSFRAIVQDESYLELLPASTLSTLSSTPGKAYIVGSTGISVPSISDPTTLATEGFFGIDELDAESIRLTANRILVSTSVDDSPVRHDYYITYVASSSNMVSDVLTNAAEHPMLGSIDITFKEE